MNSKRYDCLDVMAITSRSQILRQDRLREIDARFAHFECSSAIGWLHLEGLKRPLALIFQADNLNTSLGI
jgi:hypothetical protein